MHEIKKITLHVAIAVRHRVSPAADRHRDIVVRQQILPAAARVARIRCYNIAPVDLTRPVVAFEPHHLVRPVGAVEHRHRPGKALPAQMLLPQIAEPDPRLTHKAPARKMDPRARHPTSSQLHGKKRISQPKRQPSPTKPWGLVPPLPRAGEELQGYIL